MKPVYKVGTTATQIIEDGWSRGFCLTQTMDELKAQGYKPNAVEVLRAWVALDERYSKQLDEATDQCFDMVSIDI